ncbi:MAG: anaerobic ribonucleoside-triphosphate reductase activating protein [Saccharofermentans sp.]|jgi:pyruvate formate lyase activating enzyme|nr:anaerobic ribonucleoside-triphosphate reductase activating protein [Saccharofermentans sp.]
MRLGGIQKLTLLDYPGVVACTVFTLGCNMRCPFCHNSLLVTKTDEAEEYPLEDFFAFLEKRRGILDGVCVTGGEPLIHSDAGEFIAKIKALGYKVKLDTNGSFPEKLEEILKSGNVDYVAMDIKNSPEKYAETVGIPGFDVSKIQRSIEIIRSSGVEYEFRTTVVSPLHNAESIAGAAQMVKGSPKYFLQNFVDSGNLINGEGMGALPEEELERALTKAKDFIPGSQIRGEK